MLSNKTLSESRISIITKLVGTRMKELKREKDMKIRKGTDQTKGKLLTLREKRLHI